MSRAGVLQDQLNKSEAALSTALSQNAGLTSELAEVNSLLAKVCVCVCVYRSMHEPVISNAAGSEQTDAPLGAVNDGKQETESAQAASTCANTPPLPPTGRGGVNLMSQTVVVQTRDVSCNGCS